MESKATKLKPVRSEILQDPSTGLPGFIAGELEEQEELLRESNDANFDATNANYGSQDSNYNSEEQIHPRRLLVIMLSMYLGTFLAAVDNTLVSTIMAHIASEFDELPRISWVATAYLLSSATFQPLYGKVSDIFGRKPLLLLTNLAFLLGCFLCGISPSFWWLVSARFVAGIGGGGVTSMCSITLSDIVPLRDRALYQGMCNFFFGLGTACGGLVGGWFSEHGGGWRMAFLMQVPLSALSTALIMIFLQLPKKTTMGPSNRSVKSKLMAIDWAGATILVTFLLLFLVTASLGGKEVPFGSKMFALLCSSSALTCALFVYVELYWAQDPILPLAFLKNPSVLGSSFSNWFCMMAMMTTSYYLPIYYSGVLNMSPTNIGKRLVPNFFSVAFGSLGAGYYMKKTGKYYWFTVGFCMVSFLGHIQINLINPQIAVWRQYILLLVPGFGYSVLITVALLAMIAAVPHEHQAATTSISYAFRSTGSTLGVSIGGALFRESLNGLLTRKVLEFSDSHPKHELLKIIEKASKSSEWVHSSAPEYIRPTLISCYHFACKDTFMFCTLCSVGTLLSISIIKEYKLHLSLDRKG
ncbi:VBA4 (YDR119W) [Zygosaccharomyces parabailii]|nr:VBA4 (YDR119W) [Zygosaccharomyces parabailii]